MVQQPIPQRPPQPVPMPQPMPIPAPMPNYQYAGFHREPIPLSPQHLPAHSVNHIFDEFGKSNQWTIYSGV